MMYLAPRALPALSQILPALGNPSPREIARYLDVCERTAYNWRAADKAPKSAVLALFWESSYGRETIDCALYNDALRLKQHCNALVFQSDNLRARIAHLEKTGDFASANAPFFVPISASS